MTINNEEVIRRTFSNSLNLYQKFSLLLIAITTFSALSYLTTYTFLFGYYFGGDKNISFSNFEVYRRFIPFHANTLATTWIMILLSVYLLNELLKLIVSKEIIKIFFASISFLFFHISISYFFAPRVTNESIIYFSAIWIVPAIILLMARFTINGITDPLKTISGAIWGIILNAIVWAIFFRDGDENIRYISLFISFFMVGILANKIPFNKLYNPFFLFPYFLILFGFIFNLLDVKFKIIEINNISTIIILILISIVSSIVSSKIFIMKLIDTVKTESIDSNEDVKQKIIKLLTTKDKREKVSFTFIPIILIVTIAIFVFIPQTSISISQYIKSLTPNIAQFQEITVLDLKGNEYIINGWIVAEKDGVLYISNVNSQLEEIKVQNYFVKTNYKNDN